MLIFKSGIIDTRSTLILQEITHFVEVELEKKAVEIHRKQMIQPECSGSHV